MRKTKSPAAKPSKKAKAASLPAGFRAIHQVPNWEPEKHKVLLGVRGEMQETVFGRGTRKENAQRFFVVDDAKLGEVILRESVNLRPLFEQSKQGDTIRVEFLGYGEKKIGQNAPRLFNVGIKE